MAGAAPEGEAAVGAPAQGHEGREQGPTLGVRQREGDVVGFPGAGEQRGLVEGESLSFDHQPIYDDDVKERVPSVEKATDQFGWNPEVKLDDALDICLDNSVETYEL